MPLTPRRLVLLCLIGLTALALATAAPPEPADGRLAADEEALRTAGVGTDGPALMTYFDRFSAKEADVKRIEKLVKDLSAEDFFVRQKATDELVVLGPPTKPHLTPLLNSADAEVVQRARHCLEQLDKTASTPFVAAAVRVLAAKNPPGATAALLKLLAAQAKDPQIVDEIGLALARVGVREGKADPALVKAMRDGAGPAKVIAAEALYRAGVGEHRDVYEKLAADADPAVRARMALAMIDRKDKAAVPVLVGVLSELPREQVWRVEDVLYGLAGDKAPAATHGSDAAGRAAFRKAWQDWWAAHGKDLDLAKVEAGKKQLGFTLIAQYETGMGKVSGSVYELDKDNKQRWKIPNLSYPVDAQVVGDDRVLVTEYTNRTVSERDTKGEVKWSKVVASIPSSARRLPNGNTLIVARNGLEEVDNKGETVKTIAPPGGGFIYAAARFPNGDLGLINNQGQYVRTDAAGKELKRFAVGTVQTIGGQIDVSPNGRVVVPLYSVGKVVEFDAEGKQVWEAAVATPGSVRRLPNGNVLVTSRTTNQVIELDRNGKTVWTYAGDGRVMGASRR